MPLKIELPGGGMLESYFYRDLQHKLKLTPGDAYLMPAGYTGEILVANQIIFARDKESHAEITDQARNEYYVLYSGTSFPWTGLLKGRHGRVTSGIIAVFTHILSDNGWE
jgi:hypothetical protein